MKKTQKDKTTAYILGALTGLMGGHKFYLEKNGIGILHMLSFVALMLSHGARPLFLLVMCWWIIDMILLGKEVDTYNEQVEANDAAIDSTQESKTEEQNPSAQSIPNGNTLKLQLARASSLLELNIINAPEFGLLNEKIASGEMILTQDKYRDVLNLKNMKERESIDDFVYEMQKSKILELKYLAQ